MSEPLKIGVIGAGAISQAYLKALEDCADARVVAIADSRPAAAEAAAEGAGARSFASHQALAESGLAEAVIICTPPATHADIALTFIERGVPVLCEKPLCLDIGTAERLKAAAERRGVLFTMASKFRYVEDVIRARALITSGLLGEIRLLENAFTASVDMSRRWNANPAMSGGGVLMDNGCHSVDIIRYLLGPIAKVTVVEPGRVAGLPVEDTVRLFARTEDGVAATADLSWSINKQLDDYITVYGSAGTMRVGWRESRYRTVNAPNWIVFGQGYDKISAFRRQVENFARAVRGEEALLIGAADAVASVAVIEAAYRALAAGSWREIAGGQRSPVVALPAAE